MQILNTQEATGDLVTETIHGTKVGDAFRWLEDHSSSRIHNWLEKQAEISYAYFDGLESRNNIRQRIAELVATSSAEAPWNVGNHYYYLKRQDGREQPIIVRRNGLFGEQSVLVDPYLRHAGDTASVAIAAISPDDRFLAYSVRDGGTDYSSIEIMDLKRNCVLPDGLPQGFCTGLVFAGDGSGFFYSHRKFQDARPNYKAVFRHRFGTSISEDDEVFCAGEAPNVFIGIRESNDPSRIVYIVFSRGKNRNTALFLHDITTGTLSAMPQEPIPGSFSPFFVNDELLACTDFGAPNFRVVRIDLAKSDPRNWQDIVPESGQRIQQFAVAGDQIFVTRVKRFTTEIESYDLAGKQGCGLPIPAHGTVYLLNRTDRTDQLFFSYTSISRPPITYCYNTKEDQLYVWDRTDIGVDLSGIAVEETTYISKDGTSVPMIVASRKDLRATGPLPTFLTAYGGFGRCVTPSFTAFGTFLLEQGCLLAVPAIRGGSELGEEWHIAGKREKRQNSFDDFFAAAEWLIAEGRSLPDRIAIGGGSNAGLLVGVAITQRPELFRAAICLGPLLDMVRYHLFDFAAGWADEYGSPDDEQDFRSLYAYSPYHRVQNGVRYPAVLLISGDADTRCNPMHARKMAARLQEATASGYPILLDYRPTWGHTPVQPLSAKIEALSRRLAFICKELSIEVRV